MWLGGGGGVSTVFCFIYFCYLKNLKRMAISYFISILSTSPTLLYVLMCFPLRGFCIFSFIFCSAKLVCKKGEEMKKVGTLSFHIVKLTSHFYFKDSKFWVINNWDQSPQKRRYFLDLSLSQLTSFHVKNEI
jgi:hypothetical protein